MTHSGRSPRELEALLEGEDRRGAREVREARRRGVEDLGELERLDGAHLLRVRVRVRVTVRVIRVRVRVIRVRVRVIRVRVRVRVRVPRWCAPSRPLSAAPTCTWSARATP